MLSLSTRRRLGDQLPWLAAVYGIRPWEVDMLTAGEVLDFQSELPHIVQILAPGEVRVSSRG